MKSSKIIRRGSIFLTLLMIVFIVPASVMAAQPPVNLGTDLKPGIFDSADGTTSTLITAPDSNVSLLNSARFCRLFWKVGSLAALGTNAHYVGHIFAPTSIAAQTGATVQGQLTARNGEVVLGSNTITNGICANAVTSAHAAPEITATPITAATITKSDESSNIILIVIGLLMFGAVGGLLLVFQQSRRKTTTVTAGIDYREPHPKNQ